MEEEKRSLGCWLDFLLEGRDVCGPILRPLNMFKYYFACLSIHPPSHILYGMVCKTFGFSCLPSHITNDGCHLFGVAVNCSCVCSFVTRLHSVNHLATPDRVLRLHRGACHRVGTWRGRRRGQVCDGATKLSVNQCVCVCVCAWILLHLQMTWDTCTCWCSADHPLNIVEVELCKQAPVAAWYYLLGLLYSKTFEKISILCDWNPLRTLSSIVC